MRLSLTSLTLALAAIPVLVSQEAPPDPAPRPQLAYQGRLLEAGQPVTGTRTFTFILLDPQGAELWNSGPLSIGVSNGLYAVVLGGGDQPAIPNGILPRAGLKLRMVLGTQPLSPDVDLVPALQARSAFEVTGAFGGDVKGTQGGLTVLKLQGVPLDAANPSMGQGLVFNGTAWVPGTVAGTPGPQGEKGDTGARGPAGPKGDTGAASTVPGPTGPQGSMGPTGPAGPQGVKGDTGIQGFQGPKGDTGAASTVPGPMGPQGSTGPVGPAGPQGVKGDTGIQGPKGDTGTQGLQGPKGDTGAASTVPGPTGPQGSVGPMGPAGPQGVKGDTGTQGPKGDTGTQGLQGTKGDTGAASTVPGPMGPQGPVGPVGPAGPQGIKGDTGASGGRTLWSGTANPTGADGSDGDFWLNTATSTMFGPKAAGAWPAGWSIKGNPGDTGAPGAKGDTGLQGIQGLKGDTGAAGAAGPQGPAGSGAFQVDAGTGAATYTGGAVGVGTAAPAATAQMEITSTTKGFLPPRMTQAQRLAIPSPAEGLMVYQTDGAKGIYVFDGSTWMSLAPARSVTFSYNGGRTGGSAQTWTVPTGVTSLTIECWGAQGGGNSELSGLGGYAKGTLAVTAGQILTINVGGMPFLNSQLILVGGWNGGGAGSFDYVNKGVSFPGGGATDVWATPTGGTAARMIVAGGGGGGLVIAQFMDLRISENYSTGTDNGAGLSGQVTDYFIGTDAYGGPGGGYTSYPGRPGRGGKAGDGYLDPSLTNGTMSKSAQSGNGKAVISW